MNDSKYKYTLYIILMVIVATIGIQVYWNYRNYLTDKQQFFTDIQTTLDKAVDDYYTNIAQNTSIGFSLEKSNPDSSVVRQITKTFDSSNVFLGIDSLEIDSMEGITVINGVTTDSIITLKSEKHSHLWTSKNISERFNKIRLEIDSLKRSDFEKLTSKIIISISNDTLNLNSIDHLIVQDLKQKKMELDFFLEFKNSDHSPQWIEKQIIDYNKTSSLSKTPLSVISTSKFLPTGSELRMNFENETWLVFKRGIGSVLISSLLVLVVISCLFYLLNIIKHQKQLSAVKNDLISNITHEFKTPIATIGVALESLQNFNAIEDKQKTKSYLDMSSNQLSKLNTMVEKLLETASLDSENLELNKERYDISEVVVTILEKHKLQNEKIVNYDIEDHVFANVDVFHFENAINNVIDNAFKYGGETINVTLHPKSSNIELIVIDNGTSLSKANKDKIFEKFYRVPKGNTHDVKGFGIGLYYTKKIIEKHKGSIELQLNKTTTSFKITLPYA